MKKSLFVAIAALVTLGACKSDLGTIPTVIPLGFLTLSTQDQPGDVHKTLPVAYFVDAVNVTIPNSAVSADTCADIPFPGTAGLAPLAQVDAGTPVIVAMTTDTAQLTPQPVDANGYILYKLPAGDSLTIVPGSVGRFTIPGATNGFHAFDLPFTTADSLHLDPIDASTTNMSDMTLTWNPQVGPHSSVVVQLEFNAGSSSVPNEQILCQFTDNGTHDVEAQLANLWRRGSAKHVHAYRFLTTPTSDNEQEVVVLSQYSTDATQIINP
jgi:hypothetical protein